MSKKEFTPADVRRLTSVEAMRNGQVRKDTVPAKAQSAVDKRRTSQHPQASRPATAQPVPPRPRPRPPNGPSTTGEVSGEKRGNNPPRR